ncbi:MAG: hypothetical protein ACJAY2_002029 [Pseudomonadales bacterium]|jgi:hypothetical protein
MLARFLNNIAVGLSNVSPRDITENSTGPTHLVDTALHSLSDFTKVSVAGCQFRPGIAVTNDRPSIKHVMRQTLIFHPASVGKTVFVLTTKPFCASQFSCCFGLIHYSL